MSSAARCGYAFSTSLLVAPDANNSSRNSTLIRVPLTMGFPPRMAGSLTIRVYMVPLLPRGRVLERLLDVLPLQVGIAFQDLLERGPAGDLADDHGHRDSHAPDTGSPTHD